VQPILAIAYGFALLWGALWGSFLNVVVYRVPAGLSVVRPASRCPHCLTPITWWQNIPVLSWAVLRGRCFACKAPISPRYPAIETLTAALSLAVVVPWIPAWISGFVPPWQVLVAVLGEQLLVFTLLAIALIDADTFLVPDALSLPLPILGILLAVVVGEARGVTWQQAGAGALVAGGGLLAIQWGYAALTGREGLGTGDVKLLAGIGAFLGLASLPAVLLLASLQGLAFALIYAGLARGKATEERGLQSLRHLALPFGPFLAVAAVQWLMLHRLLAGVLPSFGG
jgi:leader peptidase (prepilin peptidase)/N-methyltransferase